MDCGRAYELVEYLEEIDEELWENISRRDCDRA